MKVATQVVNNLNFAVGVICARIWEGEVIEFSNFTIDNLAIHTRALTESETNT